MHTSSSCQVWEILPYRNMAWWKSHVFMDHLNKDRVGVIHILARDVLLFCFFYKKNKFSWEQVKSLRCIVKATWGSHFCLQLVRFSSSSPEGKLCKTLHCIVLSPFLVVAILSFISMETAEIEPSKNSWSQLLPFGLQFPWEQMFGHCKCVCVGGGGLCNWAFGWERKRFVLSLHP